MNQKFWVGVVSEEHVRIGEKGEFAQLCHGKCAPLKKMKEGDWLIYYSPKTKYPDGKPLQSFTAIGTVKSGIIYRFEMNPQFIPFRMDIEYQPCQNISLSSIKKMLEFVNENANIGLLFRRGHFEIEQKDFMTIANAMGVTFHGMEIKV
ncbi:EVE domain-containing protein [Viridibacillus arvi]|uniref:EVE domain-containing protein n=1 Tax=Viridibacillus arvi TaxID=263475 RepID=UPI0036A3620E